MIMCSQWWVLFLNCTLARRGCIIQISAGVVTDIVPSSRVSKSKVGEIGKASFLLIYYIIPQVAAAFCLDTQIEQGRTFKGFS